MSKETEKADEIDRGIHKEIREKRTGVRKFMADLLNMHDGMMSYEEIDEMMLENTVIHGPNMWILCLAALIASIGLNMNSTAVIIGAMLISPLMSGIMTMGYSLAVRDPAAPPEGAATLRNSGRDKPDKLHCVLPDHPDRHSHRGDDSPHQPHHLGRPDSTFRRHRRRPSETPARKRATLSRAWL